MQEHVHINHWLAFGTRVRLPPRPVNFLQVSYRERHYIVADVSHDSAPPPPKKEYKSVCFTTCYTHVHPPGAYDI